MREARSADQAMIAFSNLHVITVEHGEVYVHHFWLLWLCAVSLVSLGKKW